MKSRGKKIGAIVVLLLIAGPFVSTAGAQAADDADSRRVVLPSRLVRPVSEVIGPGRTRPVMPAGRRIGLGAEAPYPVQEQESRRISKWVWIGAAAGGGVLAAILLTRDQPTITAGAGITVGVPVVGVPQ